MSCIWWTWKNHRLWSQDHGLGCEISTFVFVPYISLPTISPKSFVQGSPDLKSHLSLCLHSYYKQYYKYYSFCITPSSTRRRIQWQVGINGNKIHPQHPCRLTAAKRTPPALEATSTQLSEVSCNNILAALRWHGSAAKKNVKPNAVTQK